MFEVGRVCVKIAGREAGSKCVVVKKVDKNFVMIDGEVKRRKCNVDHLVELPQVLDIKEGASTEVVKEALKKSGLLVEKVKVHKKEKKEKKSQRPKRAKKVKEKPATPEKKEKKPEKKEPKKEEKKEAPKPKKAAKK